MLEERGAIEAPLFLLADDHAGLRKGSAICLGSNQGKRT